METVATGDSVGRLSHASLMAMLETLRVASFNVNGIRAADRRGFGDWLERRNPDVVALQEVRCAVEDLPLDAFGDYHLAYHPGSLRGRNGVAVMTRQPAAAVRVWGTQAVTVAPGQAPQPHPDDPHAPLARELRHFAEEGRYLEVDLADVPLTVASLYLPKGGTPFQDEASLARYHRKMGFLTGFTRQLSRSRRAARAAGQEFLLMGDLNVAHTTLDLAAWRTNQKSEGFLPEEREWFDSITGSRTLVDVVRRLHPDQPGPYSWWSWRGQAWANDSGWRIDYHLASPRLAAGAISGGTDRDASYEARISDHAPVCVDYDVSAWATSSSAEGAVNIA